MGSNDAPQQESSRIDLEKMQLVSFSEFTHT